MKKIILLLAILISATTLQAQLLYKISGNGLEKPSYIFGTHHLAPLSICDSIPGMKQALEETAAVVGELDMTINPMELAMKMQPYMMAPADSTLTKLLSPEDMHRADSLFHNLTTMHLEAFQMMRPMVPMTIATVMLVQQSMPNFDPNQQLDKHFQQLAQEQQKPIVGLETPDLQAKVLYCSTPIAEQAKTLLEMLEDPGKSMLQAEEMNKAYMAQDLERLAQLGAEEQAENEPFMEALLKTRNADWLTKLPGIMEQQPVFIAVGALHLPGEAGLLEGLRRLGYTLAPL